MASYILSSVILVSRNPVIPNWYEKTLFTPLCSSCTHFRQRVCSSFYLNSYGEDVSFTKGINNDFSNQFGIFFPSPNLLQLFRRMLQHCFCCDAPEMLDYQTTGKIFGESFPVLFCRLYPHVSCCDFPLPVFVIYLPLFLCWPVFHLFISQ